MRFIKKQLRTYLLRSFVTALLVVLLIMAIRTEDFAEAFNHNTNSAHELVDAPKQHENGKKPEANLPYLFTVFIITWAGFFAYAFIISRRQRHMQQEIEVLKGMLRDAEVPK